MNRIAIIDRGRGPELAGTRITVFDIIPYLKAGRSANYIAAVFNLATTEVLALMRYIEEHRDEVMAINQQIEERIARGNSPEIEAKRQASRAKLLALKAELERRKTSESEANGASDPR